MTLCLQKHVIFVIPFTNRFLNPNGLTIELSSVAMYNFSYLADHKTFTSGGEQSFTFHSKNNDVSVRKTLPMLLTFWKQCGLQIKMQYLYAEETTLETKIHGFIKFDVFDKKSTRTSHYSITIQISKKSWEDQNKFRYSLDKK
ncbi:hypothetical protein CHS0354_026006 [Potamilus streckersoni]|uniref:Uncharacterized protein n=1 Tax=Potamilus streckersoni TaxID=2493646 RepID=A0AAE0RYR8_9BIVA|nr:hypothetical protein CHS0354_026006 [Potamilus streckersoni]